MMGLAGECAMATAKPEIKAFFDEPTNTVSYLVWDPATKDAAVVDPVLDFDHKSGEANVKAADTLLAEAARLGLKIGRVLETHVHADHLFKDGERFSIGAIDAEVMYTPGHTPACVSYRIGDSVFVGDTMFMPDYGTARADFPGGDAHALYRSIRRSLSLPPQTRLFMCHDYKAPGRDQYAWETTGAEEKARNVQVHDGVSEEEFVAKRVARDKTLSTPLLLLPSIQVNMRAGHFPPAEANGVRYLKVPLKLGA